MELNSIELLDEKSFQNVDEHHRRPSTGHCLHWVVSTLMERNGNLIVNSKI